MTTNTLYYGDNLDILRRYVADETVDLVYLDPPFNSKATYNVLFQEKDGSAAAAQIEAFDDFWHWDQAAAEAYRDVVETGGQVAEAMRAFRILLGPNDMLAYLAMIRMRPSRTAWGHSGPKSGVSAVLLGHPRGIAMPRKGPSAYGESAASISACRALIGIVLGTHTHWPSTSSCDAFIWLTASLPTYS